MARIGRQMVQAGTVAMGQALKQAARQSAKAAKAPKAPKAPRAAKAVKSATPARQRKPAPAAATPLRLALPGARRRAAVRQRTAQVLAAAPGRWTSGVAVAGSCARRWRLYTPPGLLAGERVPVLVLLHGCGQDAEGFAAVTGLHKLAQRGRFLVLLPEQDRLANANGCWNWFDTGHGRAQAEADAVLAAIDQACARRGDRQRVVVAGLSAGASLAALLALRHPARLCGVVMHSGVPPGTAASALAALRAMQGRNATAPLDLAAGAPLPPLLVVHGSLDGVVSPRNAQAAVQAWADLGGALPGAPRRVQRGQRLAMLVTDHKRRGHTVATLALVQGLSHAWSGGAAGLPFSDPAGPDASRLVWAFAQKLFARRAVALAAAA